MQDKTHCIKYPPQTSGLLCKQAVYRKTFLRHMKRAMKDREAAARLPPPADQSSIRPAKTARNAERGIEFTANALTANTSTRLGTTPKILYRAHSVVCKRKNIKIHKYSLKFFNYPTPQNYLLRINTHLTSYGDAPVFITASFDIPSAEFTISSTVPMYNPSG